MFVVFFSCVAACVAYSRDLPALRPVAPLAARELAQPANTDIYTPCTKTNLAPSLYNGGNFNHMLQLVCSAPSTGSVTLVAGAHDLIISNPQRAPLVIFHTDGTDCGKTGSNFAFYGPAFSSSAETITTSGRCFDNKCCTIIKCDTPPTSSGTRAACSYGIASSVYYVPGGASASPSRVPSQSPTRSGTGTPRAAGATRSDTPTRTPTPPPTPTKTSVSSPSRTPSQTQTAPPAGVLPRSWDPRTDPRYQVCYNTGILDQGQCGSCYAFSPAYVMTIALCRALVDAGLRNATGGPMKVVSPQFMLAIKTVQDGYTPDTFCSGGSPTMLLLSYAVQIHNARNASGFTQLSRLFNLLTCKPDATGKSCATGCYPYTAGGCPAPSGGIVNPAGSSSTSSSCTALSFEQRLCPATGTLDADSYWLTNTSRFWTAVPSMVDPSFPPNAWEGTSMRTGFFQADVRASGSIFYDALRAMTTTANNGAWSDAAIATVKRYLRERGSLAVAVNMCETLTSFISSAVRANLGPRVYDGPGCPPGINHAVTIVGWAEVADSQGNSQPAWIVRNEWGNRWGWTGDFYVHVSNASVNDGSRRGGVSLSQPFGLAFFPPPSQAAGPRGRELAEDHERRMAVVREHSARLLQAMSEDPPPPTGTVANCSNDAAMLRVAAAVAKQQMDKELPVEGLSYTAFSVHVLECQTVGLGKIYKAAVTAEHPITGARDAAHITFYHGDNPDAAPPAAPPVDAQGLPIMDENGVPQDFPAAEADEDGYSALPPAGPHAAGPEKGARRLEAAVGNAPATTTTVYDSVIIAGTVASGSDSGPATNGAASAPGTNVPPVTNPNTQLDLWGMTLSVRAQVMLVQSAVIIVGAFLLFVISYTLYALWHYRAVLQRTARKASDAFKHGVDVLRQTAQPSGGGGAAVAPAPEGALTVPATTPT